MPEPTIENYKNLAGAICAAVAEEMIEECIEMQLYKTLVRREEHKWIYDQCAAFFRSPRFTLYCPGLDGEEVISLINQQAKKQLKGRRWYDNRNT